MKRINVGKVFRIAVLVFGLTFSPVVTPVFAQADRNDNRPADRRDDDRDRDRRDRDRDDFPWGLLGLAGLAGLLGLKKPKREIYVDERNMPPPPR